LIARQMVQAAREALRDFKFSIEWGQQQQPAIKTPQDVVNWINTTGELTSTQRYTLYDLFNANQTHVLTAGKRLTIGGGTYTVPSSSEPKFSFESIAQDVYQGAFTDLALAMLNASKDGILQVGRTISYDGQSYTTQARDRLDKIAADQFKAPLDNFLIESNVLS